MSRQKGHIFYKLGAWILVIAGFGHALIAIPDMFCSGLFSPVSKDVLSLLENDSLKIVDLSNGQGTSLLESAWGAYIGFSIGIGVLLGFFGLILVLFAGNKDELSMSLKKLAGASAAMTAVMVAVSAIFFYYLPTLLFACSLVCFVLAWASLNSERHHEIG